MKKTFCLIISLLLALPLLAGCNDASFLTDPAGESESISVSAPSVIEEEGESPSPIPSPAPQKSPTPSPLPSFPELPLPVEEIYFDVHHFGLEEYSTFDYPTSIFSTPPYCHFPQEVKQGEQAAVFKLYIDAEAHLPFGRAELVALYKEDLQRLEDLSKGLPEKELTEEERRYFKSIFDAEGNLIPAELEAAKARARYAVDFYTVALEQGEQALWQQVKTDWMARCEKAGITTVDVGGDYLYIVCTGPQLLSLAKEEELYAALYTVDTVSLKDYAADRVNILK